VPWGVAKGGKGCGTPFFGATRRVPLQRTRLGLKRASHAGLPKNGGKKKTGRGRAPSSQEGQRKIFPIQASEGGQRELTFFRSVSPLEEKGQ